MAGYIHITRLSSRTGTNDTIICDYQVNYLDSGINYAVAWDEDRLLEFLEARVPLSEFEVAQVLLKLREDGSATIGDVHIPADEVSSMGMAMITDDM